MLEFQAFCVVFFFYIIAEMQSSKYLQKLEIESQSFHKHVQSYMHHAVANVFTFQGCRRLKL